MIYDSPSTIYCNPPNTLSYYLYSKPTSLHIRRRVKSCQLKRYVFLAFTPSFSPVGIRYMYSAKIIRNSHKFIASLIPTLLRILLINRVYNFISPDTSGTIATRKAMSSIINRITYICRFHDFSCSQPSRAFYTSFVWKPDHLFIFSFLTFRQTGKKDE